MTDRYSIDTVQLEGQDAVAFCRFWDVFGVHWEPDDLCALFQEENARVVLVKVDGNLIGTAAFYESGDNTHFLSFVGVDTAFQGHGIGRAIVEYTLDHEQTAWELNVNNDNAVAVGLYKSLGFTCKDTLGSRSSRFRLEK